MYIYNKLGIFVYCIKTLHKILPWSLMKSLLDMAVCMYFFC